MTPANCPGMTRPLLWTNRSGNTTAGGRFVFERVTALAMAAMLGQSVGIGFDGLNPVGMADRPVIMM
jgi:hypothetical protein